MQAATLGPMPGSVASASAASAHVGRAGAVVRRWDPELQTHGKGLQCVHNEVQPAAPSRPPGYASSEQPTLEGHAAQAHQPGGAALWFGQQLRHAAGDELGAADSCVEKRVGQAVHAGQVSRKTAGGGAEGAGRHARGRSSTHKLAVEAHR